MENISPPMMPVGQHDPEDPKMSALRTVDTQQTGTGKLLQAIAQDRLKLIGYVMLTWILALTLSNMIPITIKETLDYALKDTQHEYLRIVVHWFDCILLAGCFVLSVIALWKLDMLTQKGDNSGLVAGNFSAVPSIRKEVETAGLGRVQETIREWQTARTQQQAYQNQVSANKKHDPPRSKPSHSTATSDNASVPSSTRRRQKAAFRY